MEISEFQITETESFCGTGIVDSSRGSSAFLPISSSGGGISIVGSEGGYWYFDKVDTLGTQPLEQIEGSGDNGLDSAFFSLGTVRINGLETVTGEVQYSINGSVSATIGPLSSVIVQVPEHDHLYFSAVTDGEEGELSSHGVAVDLVVELVSNSLKSKHILTEL